LGNNSPLIQWREEEWGWGEGGGQLQKRKKNVYVLSNAKHADKHGLLSTYFTQKVQTTHEK